MKLGHLTLAMAALALVLAVWSATEIRGLRTKLDEVSKTSHSDLLAPINPTSQATNVEQRLVRLELAPRGLGDVMSDLQIHFAKLKFAAEARNWDLARFECGEVEEHLKKAAMLRPDERGVGIAGIIDAFKNTQLTQLKDAIDVKDRTLFREAYQQCILMCNSCHQATGRSFITIITPTNSPVPNQRWDLPPENETKL